jgi:hypothetical protein
MASAVHGRTYHNTAALLADGRVLVGGHAPIPTGYGSVRTLPGGFSNNDRDPSFEIYSPPYLFWGPRPAINAVGDRSIRYGTDLTITTPDADHIKKVVLMRDTAITHLVDADQRTVELKIKSAQGDALIVSAPPDARIAPPGPYRLFIDSQTPKGLIPSLSKQVYVGGPVPAYLRSGLERGQGDGQVEALSERTTPLLGLPNTGAARPVGAWLLLLLLPTLALALLSLRRRRT